MWNIKQECYQRFQNYWTQRQQEAIGTNYLAQFLGQFWHLDNSFSKKKNVDSRLAKISDLSGIDIPDSIKRIFIENIVSNKLTIEVTNLTFPYIAFPTNKQMQRTCENSKAKYGIQIEICSIAKLEERIKELQSCREEKLIGLIVTDAPHITPHSVNQRTSVTVHVTPIICNFNQGTSVNTEWLVLDSLGNRSLEPFFSIEKIFENLQINVLIATERRQADQHSCRTASLTILRNALLDIQDEKNKGTFEGLHQKVEIEDMKIHITPKWTFTDQISDKRENASSCFIKGKHKTVGSFRQAHTTEVEIESAFIFLKSALSEKDIEKLRMLYPFLDYKMGESQEKLTIIWKSKRKLNTYLLTKGYTNAQRDNRRKIKKQASKKGSCAVFTSDYFSIFSPLRIIGVEKLLNEFHSEIDLSRKLEIAQEMIKTIKELPPSQLDFNKDPTLRKLLLQIRYFLKSNKPRSEDTKTLNTSQEFKENKLTNLLSLSEALGVIKETGDLQPLRLTVEAGCKPQFSDCLKHGYLKPEHMNETVEEVVFRDAFEIAYQKNNLEILRLVARAGARPDEQDIDLILTLIISDPSKKEWMHLLIEMDVLSISRALQHVQESGDLEPLRLVINAGRKPQFNDFSKYGYSKPEHIYQTFEELIFLEAFNVVLKTENVLKQDNYEVLELVVKAGARPDQNTLNLLILKVFIDKRKDAWLHHLLETGAVNFVDAINEIEKFKDVNEKRSLELLDLILDVKFIGLTSSFRNQFGLNMYVTRDKYPFEIVKTFMMMDDEFSHKDLKLKEAFILAKQTGDIRYLTALFNIKNIPYILHEALSLTSHSNDFIYIDLAIDAFRDKHLSLPPHALFEAFTFAKKTGRVSYVQKVVQGGAKTYSGALFDATILAHETGNDYYVTVALHAGATLNSASNMSFETESTI